MPLVADVAGPLTAGGNPLVVLGAIGAGGAVLALAAAGAAPAGVGPRAAVIAVSLANGGAGLWLATLETPTTSGMPLLANALTGPLEGPALAWLGAALATGLGDRIGRSWRTSLLLTGVLAALQVLLSVVAVGTYGAAFRFSGGFTAYVVVANALGSAAGVAVAHVVVSAHRTWRVLGGQPPLPLRPWWLAVALVAAVAFSMVAGWLSGGL